MKERAGIRLLVLAVTAMLVGGLGLAAAQDAPAPTPVVEGGAPTVVSYQGQVLVSGSPYTGDGYFKFAVVDSEGTTSFWSNDGTSTGGSQPTASVQLTVSQGLFNVLLGDTTLGGMTEALSASVFAGTDRWLRTWFSSDGSAFVQLSPDRRIAAIPYALQAEEAVNADTLDGLQGSAYQQRVGGACAVGSTIRAISADGTVTCQFDAPLRRSAPPQANVATVVDTAEDVGEQPSITIGADGLPVVSFYDSSNGDLKVAHCGDAACATGNTLTTVDSDGNVGSYTSITIGADGLPVVSYYDSTNGDLRVAHCGDVACATGNTLTTVDSDGSVGSYNSITIGADGLPVVSYYDSTNDALKVLRCGNVLCSTASSVTVDWTEHGDVGRYNSITIGGDGLPLVSYHDYEEAALKVAHCGNAGCTGGNTLTEVDPGPTGRYTSVTIGADGLPVVSYYNMAWLRLQVLHCGNAACTTDNTITTVDSTTGHVGEYTSITIGSDGLPVISYRDYTNENLKVAHCGNAACTMGNTLTTVEPLGYFGLSTSITIGADGLPVVSYHYEDGYVGSELRVLHCSNVFCVPYWRRR